MRYIIDINDESEYGITGAREAYNSSLPATISVPSEVEGEPATDEPNPDLLTTNSDYITHVMKGAVESYCRQYAPVAPPPEVPPTVVNGVPQQVTRRQAKTLMELTPHPAGNLWLAALAAAEAIPDAQTRIVTTNYLMESLYFEYPQVLAMAGQLLSMTSEQVDQLFIAAAKL